MSSAATAAAESGCARPPHTWELTDNFLDPPRVIDAWYLPEPGPETDRRYEEIIKEGKWLVTPCAAPDVKLHFKGLGLDPKTAGAATATTHKQKKLRRMENVLELVPLNTTASVGAMGDYTGIDDAGIIIGDSHVTLTSDSLQKLTENTMTNDDIVVSAVSDIRAKFQHAAHIIAFADSQATCQLKRIAECALQPEQNIQSESSEVVISDSDDGGVAAGSLGANDKLWLQQLEAELAELAELTKPELSATTGAAKQRAKQLARVLRRHCKVPDVEAFFKLDFFLGVYHHGMHFTTAVLCYPGLVCRPLAAAAKFLADNDWQHELYELEMVEAAQNAGVEGDEGGSRREACVLVLDSFHGTKAAHDPNNHARFMRYMVCQLFLRHDKQLVKNMGWKEAEKVVLSVLNQILPCRSVPHVPQQGSSSVECAYFALTSMHWFAEAACDEDGGLRLNLDAACNPEVALSTNHPQLLRSDWYHSDMPQVLYLDIRINWLRMFISKCQDMPDSSRFDKLVETSKNEIDVYERERQRRPSVQQRLLVYSSSKHFNQHVRPAWQRQRQQRSH